MKIVNLQAENFKRLRAVEITPDSEMVVLSGANEQGKSSVLDAIMAAIVGGRGMRDITEPVRRGEERAEVTLDLGDIKIHRIWESGGKNRIEVTNADGAKYSSPQGILDALTSSLTFDPLEFARMQPRDQRATLLRLVELPFDVDENDRQRLELVQAETSARQAVKRAEQDIAALPKVPDDTPDEEISAADITKEMQKRMSVKSENDEKRSELRELRNEYSMAVASVTAVEERIASLEGELAAAKSMLTGRKAIAQDAEDKGKKMAEIVNALVDPDVSELEAEIASLDEKNRHIRQKQANEEARKKLAAAVEAEVGAKSALVTHDKNRNEALKSAKFPVDELGFNEGGVTLNGLPFEQASESQRIKTSVAMGMAMNPRLRVMFIRDGSLLDSKRMDALSEMAKDKDFQLWVEKVDETGSVGIVIEDGQVKGGADN